MGSDPIKKPHHFAAPRGPYATADGKVNAEGQRIVTEYLAAYPQPARLMATKFPKLLRRAYCVKLDDDDVHSCCLEGLTRAILLYDPGHGAKFNTYASWWMMRFLQVAIEQWTKLEKGGAKVVQGSMPVGRPRQAGGRPDRDPAGKITNRGLRGD